MQILCYWAGFNLSSSAEVEEWFQRQEKKIAWGDRF